MAQQTDAALLLVALHRDLLRQAQERLAESLQRKGRLTMQDMYDQGVAAGVQRAADALLPVLQAADDQRLERIRQHDKAVRRAAEVAALPAWLMNALPATQQFATRWTA
jgi:hypothetical protein